jgi:hypothetical protein
MLLGRYLVEYSFIENLSDYDVGIRVTKFGEENYRGETPFLSQNTKDTYYLHLFLLLVLTYTIWQMCDCHIFLKLLFFSIFIM